MLALLLALGTVTACGNPDKPEQTDPNKETEPATETETVNPDSLLDLPDDLKFNDYDFKVLSAKYDEFFTQIDSENTTGDTVNDAIYDRNRLIESKYGVKIHMDQDEYPNMLERTKQQVMANDDEYELIMMVMRDAYTATLNGYLTDFSSLSYIDTEKEYYFRDINDQLTIGGKMFFAFSAESINVLSFANGILFNKVIAKNHTDFADPYELVANGEWTYDQLFTMCKAATADSDGNGRIEYGKDVIGMISDYDKAIPASWISAGCNLINRDADGDPYFSALGNERYYTVMQTVRKNFDSDSCYCYTAGDDKNKSFKNNQALFYSTEIGFLNMIRGMESDYGLLPWPKYDGEQEKYITRAEDGWLHCVPNTCSNTDRTSAILQALAFYSYQMVYPSYYERALTSQYVRDEESVEMIKLIRSNMTIDLGDTIWYQNLRLNLVANICNSKVEAATLLKRYEKVVTGLINKAIEYADSLE